MSDHRHYEGSNPTAAMQHVRHVCFFLLRLRSGLVSCFTAPLPSILGSPCHNACHVLHIKYCEPQTDISCTNAVYRLVTPRNLFHLTRGTPWGQWQAVWGVHRKKILHAIDIVPHAFEAVVIQSVIELVAGLRITQTLTLVHSTSTRCCL